MQTIASERVRQELALLVEELRPDVHEEHVLLVVELRDDAVDLRDVKQRLAVMLTERQTEVLKGGSRIHWATAEVLQGPDRLTQPRKPQRRSANGQPELLPAS